MTVLCASFLTGVTEREKRSGEKILRAEIKGATDANETRESVT